MGFPETDEHISLSFAIIFPWKSFTKSSVTIMDIGMKFLLKIVSKNIYGGT